ncbi:hypothetical protein JOF53_002560 [Crossiella equi]|uniref:Uncharacterized protein n=1 Tax=Crossiella equi TaxID=130796 RepID=A0ABS5AAT4_9PSEU|nr:hypothetical protein [Crossiella equi]MBP2473688.1 hypothetical protein [Crossiella equi]
MRLDRYTATGLACVFAGFLTLAPAVALHLGGLLGLSSALFLAVAALVPLGTGLLFLRWAGKDRRERLRAGLAAIEAVTDESLRDALHACVAVGLTGVRISMAELTALAGTKAAAGDGEATITVIGAHPQARSRR